MRDEALERAHVEERLDEGRDCIARAPAGVELELGCDKARGVPARQEVRDRGAAGGADGGDAVRVV